MHKIMHVTVALKAKITKIIMIMKKSKKCEKIEFEERKFKSTPSSTN